MSQNKQEEMSAENDSNELTDEPKGTFISNFLQNNIKTNQLEINTDVRTFRTTAKLREPRDLFALPKELDCPQQAPRWPSECQVVEERIQHTIWSPATPEAYYTPTGKELRPQPVGEDAGTVIFQYYPMSAVNYFSRSTVGGSRLYLSACATASGDDELRFESRFESGNLAKAIRITSEYYELHLRTDLYTNRHMQWFYFKVTNTKKQMMYRFSIVNLSKAESLYNEGMRPLLYSTKDAQLHSIGWRRCGDNIAYYKNDSTSEEEEQFPSYTLTFNIEFPHTDDAVYIAHCYPYTYSDLQEYLSRLQAHPIKSTYSKLRLLCRTLAGNNVYYLTITAPPSTNELEQKKKKAVIITARVHPGETPSSWMMKGFMDYLTGDSNQARELREKFIFKLVPMLNPDGVIVGNNRCSLTGKDLNRQYRTVIRETYPSVWHTKVMIRRLQEECGVAMYIDLHAHSRKHNVFIYGCESRRNSDKRLQEQVFPLMLHKNAADKFSFENCKFRIQRSKEGTGRVVVWMLGVANSYTMEASFGGSELGSRMSTHFSVQDYESLGRTFCETLLDFYDEDPSKERLRTKIVTRLLKEGSNADEPTNIDLSDYSSDEGDTSSSSSEAGTCKEMITQPAPPPSPMFPDINRNITEKPRKQRPKLEKMKRIEKKKTKRETLQVSRATIDLTSDAMTDASSDESYEESLSPVRRVHKFLHSSTKSKPRRKKKMPPELKIIPAPTSDSPYHSDREKKIQKCGRPRSVSMFNESIEKSKLNPASWHQFRCLPPPKCLSDIKNKNTQTQPSELQVKLSSLKRNVWTGVHGEDKGPLSWGISSFAMNSYFTDSEALLRSCSKKLEELEGERKKCADEKKKKKTKSKKISVKVTNSGEDILEPTNKLPKSCKKKGKLKHAKSECSPYVSNTSFTDIPRNTQQSVQKSIVNENKQAKTRFRKSAYVTTAIQTKKSSNKNNITIASDHSDSDDSCQSTKKVIKKSKDNKPKLKKSISENKSKN
ncbi:cytosolic carboxypeptidase Nna1-like isoform X1 [Galleria mellonella]|uniref:Cytosolic carboxypeptidase Nna1-like isoform X1 n=2 Tax=Galleria mellonella TaxID=7137 RepID=A0A6J3BTZ5_GALME|nr:cytosolic carboxypeptidase Nna1-like isoform X1 [Galleria mellonella]